MKSNLKLKPSDVFKTLDAYLDFLRKENFTTKLSENSVLAKNWSVLEAPRTSSFAEPAPANFCYHLRNGELASAWGLVFRDLKKSTPLAANELGVDAPEAALDILLRKLAFDEWSTDARLAGTENSNYSHVVCEPGVVIGPDCEFGEKVILESGVRIGARVKIGAGTRIGCGSRIADDSLIGSHCYFRGPVSIGGQGFGFVTYPKNPLPRHRIHVGRVFIGDHVQLGSFVAVDRGVLEDTVIGNFTATDNHVQIGHNCRLGKHNIICGFVALAGSTILGDYVTLGGLVVSKGHVTIGDKVQVGGFSGIDKDLPAGAIVRGIRARPLREDLKITAIQERLPELYAMLKKTLKGQGADL